MPTKVDPDAAKLYNRLGQLSESNTNRTDEHPNDDLVGALVEAALLAEGARRHAQEDRQLAEEGTAAGYEALPEE